MRNGDWVDDTGNVASVPSTSTVAVTSPATRYRAPLGSRVAVKVPPSPGAAVAVADESGTPATEKRSVTRPAPAALPATTTGSARSSSIGSVPAGCAVHREAGNGGRFVVGRPQAGEGQDDRGQHQGEGGQQQRSG